MAEAEAMQGEKEEIRAKFTGRHISNPEKGFEPIFVAKGR
jgi:hypothetical protein